MATELDGLVAQVKTNTDIVQSAILLVQGLAQKIADLAAAGGTPAQFADLAAQIKASDDALAAAIAANTPAAG